MRNCAAMDGKFSRRGEFCGRWLSMDWDTARSPNRLLVRLSPCFGRKQARELPRRLSLSLRLLSKHAVRQQQSWSLVQGKGRLQPPALAMFPCVSYKTAGLKALVATTARSARA